MKTRVLLPLALLLATPACDDVAGGGPSPDMTAVAAADMTRPPVDMAMAAADMTRPAGDMAVAADMTGTDDMSKTPELSCAYYCDTVMAACTGANAQFPDGAACLAYCQKIMWPAGALADISGVTLGCHIYHATAARQNPGLHCYHAGATGGNVCGTWCESYCQLAKTACTGNNATFASDMECATKCAMIPTGGKTGDVAGDSLQCRFYHLGVALTLNPGLHCPHGKTLADLPGGPCK